jgi:uncharacterized protein (DUF433 family)
MAKTLRATRAHVDIHVDIKIGGPFGPAYLTDVLHTLGRTRTFAPCLEVSAQLPILLVLRGPGRSHSGLIRLIRKKLSSKLFTCPVHEGGTRYVTLFRMSEDLLLPNSENPLIWINPQRVSGTPCFYKTRLPIDSLFDNLEDGVSLDEWLDAFPDITRAQAQAVLELAKQTMLASGK